MQPFFLILFLGVINLTHGQDFRTPVGSPCSRAADDCVKNAECVSSSICLCKAGYSTDPSLGCKVDYDGKCSTSSDCNTPIGLHCVNSVCKCTSNDEFLPDIGTCVNSTMKLMFEDVVQLINKTEVELTKFSTLLHIFMIHSSTPKDENDTVSVGLADININPNLYQQLENLEEQLKSGDDPVPVVAPLDNNNLVLSEQNEAKTEVPSSGGSTRQIDPNPVSAPPVQAIPAQQFPLPIQPTIGTTPQITTPNLPNSINSLIFPIVPNQPNPGNLNNLGPGNLRQGQVGLPPLGINPGAFDLNNLNNNLNNLNNLNFNSLNSLNQQVDSLANVLPQFLSMFKQFLPMLQSFNNVLGSSILNQSQQGGLPGAGNLNNLNNNRGLFGLLQRPGGAGGSGGVGGVLQFPGRIFNGLFGRNSTIQMLKRRIIPIDFTNKAIPFLPWPLG